MDGIVQEVLIVGLIVGGSFALSLAALLVALRSK